MRTVPPALGLAALIALAGCGSGSGGSHAATNPQPTASSSSDQSAAVADITTAWTTFFHTGTKPAAAEALLQNGDHMAKAIKVASQVQKQSKIVEDAKVTKVDLTSPTTATVTYDLLSHGSTLLPGATGQAVLDGGQWKVSTSTFCTLVELGAGGKKVPGC
jgi:outer membrane protein TolC